MQRLSLDSSASKLHSYGGRKDETYDIDDLKRKESVSVSPSSSSSAADYDDHELKDFKPRRLSLQSPFPTTHQKQEKLVHFIPVLTLICFIILYLSSHAPSQSGFVLSHRIPEIQWFSIFWCLLCFLIGF